VKVTPPHFCDYAKHICVLCRPTPAQEKTDKETNSLRVGKTVKTRHETSQKRTRCTENRLNSSRMMSFTKLNLTRISSPHRKKKNLRKKNFLKTRLVERSQGGHHPPNGDIGAKKDSQFESKVVRNVDSTLLKLTRSNARQESTQNAYNRKMSMKIRSHASV